MRTWPIALLLLLAGCVGGERLPMNDQAAEKAVLPTDPCALLTIEEVEAATGGSVSSFGVIPDERLHSPDPETANPCGYVTDGRHASITVHVFHNRAGEFSRYRRRDPLNTYPVEGVGDEAFSVGLASLWVRVGEDYFLLVSQHCAGRLCVRDLRELALSALD